MKTPPDLPPGYVTVPAGRIRAFALEEAAEVVGGVLSSGDTMSAWGAREAVHVLSGGRGPAYLVEAEGQRWVVRHYRRGGAVAGVLGDRYLAAGTPRPFREAAAAAAARAAGVRTPAVVAGAVYPAGPFYRADLVTAWVEGARPLAEVLAGSGAAKGGPAAASVRPPAGPTAVAEAAASPPPHGALEAAGGLIAALAAAGLRHADLNAHNVLLRQGNGGLEAWVLDLDRCAVGVPPQAAAATMSRRLLRSVEKLVKAKGGGVPDAWRDVLHEAAAEAGGAEPAPGDGAEGAEPAHGDGAGHRAVPGGGGASRREVDP